jgi:hypothetical protein
MVVRLQCVNNPFQTGEASVVDRYTKTVLTIIAIALVGLLAVQLTPTAHAQGTDACGGYTNPCYVKATAAGLEVYVQNFPPPAV